MNKFEEIVSTAHLPVAIVCNPPSEYYMLDFPLPENLTDALDRGMAFVGVIGLVDGAAKFAWAVPLDVVSIDKICAAYAKKILSAVAPSAPKSDGEEWLSRLHQLPDPRA